MNIPSRFPGTHYATFVLSLFLICINADSADGQKGIQLNSPEAYESFTLCDDGNGNAYLIDNCGKIVNHWIGVFPVYHSRLTEDGLLMFLNYNGIIFRDWDNNHVKFIHVNHPNLFIEYEAIPLKNGNFLAISRRYRSEAFFDSIGYALEIGKPTQTDGVIEIDPEGNIVWEWNIGDHTIQDKVPTATNYGVVSEHPELVDINAISTLDWTPPESFMINGMNYNEELDQIVLSVRKMGEIMIIDHSTTTEEAKGSTGGKYGKGGDILYRWGNPKNYGRGTDDDQVFYYQHNPNWIKYGPHKGKIILFNNGLSKVVPGIGDMSSVHIIDTPVDDDGNYEITTDQPFYPESPDLTIDALTTGNNFYSGYTSGAVVLPNESIYITVGLGSYLLEVKPNGEEVWRFNIEGSDFIFRSEKYSPDYPGFEGKDMTGNGTIEFPPSQYECDLFTSTQESEVPQLFELNFNPTSKRLTVEKVYSSTNKMEIFDSNGGFIRQFNNLTNGYSIDLSSVPMGTLFIKYTDTNSKQHQVKRIIIPL